jgi:spore coat polysaccharide biosynthesis protein SpsF
VRKVVLIQARMTSTRLPGKILMEVAGRPMLAQLIARLERCRSVDEIVVATTTNSSDDPVVELCRSRGTRVWRGPEHDVLVRFQGAAADARAEVIVRITADCPLIDPLVVDRVVEALLEGGCDYASNTRTRTFPRGLDAEALHLDVLTRCGRLARSVPAREHVTYFVVEQPQLFAIREVVDPVDNSDLRWTVDTAVDLELVRRIYALGRMPSELVPHAELIAMVRKQPELVALNAHIPQKKY